MEHTEEKKVEMMKNKEIIKSHLNTHKKIAHKYNETINFIFTETAFDRKGVNAVISIIHDYLFSILCIKKSSHTDIDTYFGSWKTKCLTQKKLTRETLK